MLHLRAEKKDVFIPPRTGVLHAWLSPKRQNLITLASGEKLFFPYSLKGLQFRPDYMGD